MVNTKERVYIKLLSVYTLIIILMILFLDSFFIIIFFESINDNRSYMNDKVIYDVNEHLTNTNNTFNISIANMYRDNYIITDIIEFLRLGENEYLKNKLDKYSATHNSFYKGIEYFTEGCFNYNEKLENIEFISYVNNEIVSFDRTNKRNHRYISDAITYEHTINSGYIYDIREINNPITYRPEGKIIFIYNLNFIDKILDKYDNKNEIMI